MVMFTTTAMTGVFGAGAAPTATLVGTIDRTA